jgi:hypothetical protein
MARACPAGTSSPVYGATSINTCGLCALKEYSLAAATACSPCPQGFYCTSPAATPIACPGHTVSPQASVSALDCICLSGYTCTYGRRLSITFLLHNTTSTVQQMQADAWLAQSLQLAVNANLNAYDDASSIHFGGFSVL